MSVYISISISAKFSSALNYQHVFLESNLPRNNRSSAKFQETAHALIKQ